MQSNETRLGYFNYPSCTSGTGGNMSFTESPEVRSHGAYKELEQRVYSSAKKAAHFLIATPEAPAYMSNHYKKPGEIGGVAIQLSFEDDYLNGYSESADSLREV